MSPPPPQTYGAIEESRHLREEAVDLRHRSEDIRAEYVIERRRFRELVDEQKKGLRVYVHFGGPKGLPLLLLPTRRTGSSLVALFHGSSPSILGSTLVALVTS